MTKIAVIGSGISGLTCAYLLRDRYGVTLFEQDDRLGGHTHTHKIGVEEKEVTVDTGFIVYNDRTYPNFMRLLDELGCRGQPTEMSFSLTDQSQDFEYNGHNLNTLFAKRQHLLSLRFWWMIRDILKFNRLAKSGAIRRDMTLDEVMTEYGFGKLFRTRYLYPMAAAIWSTGDQAIGQFPAGSLIDFFVNHGLVDLKNRPQWYVVDGGSSQYIQAMAPYLKDVRLSTPVTQVTRHTDKIVVHSGAGMEEFDQVIFACHSDQALRILDEPSAPEQEVLGNMRYTPNTAYLHTDPTRLPLRRLAWASWNYSIPYSKSLESLDKARLTYNMNILQGIKTNTPVLVTLNDPDIASDKIIGQYEYAHPFFDQNMIHAQERHREISGRQRTHYCGAYWFYGFHEDGVKSAIRVCDALGVTW